jgi:hypothetical protein
MTGLLIRVGSDQSFGHANAPIRAATGEFVYVPIPEADDRVNLALGCPYRQVEAPVRDLVGNQRDLAPWLPARTWMHLDPDFEHLTYGNNENSKGTRLGNLRRGDFLAFYASLKAVDQPKTLIYALIGLLVVERVLKADAILEADWHRNAHTRRAAIIASDVVLFGQPGVSGRLARAIPIGEYRDRAYRVRPDLLEAWGNLSVKDGYIQRSAVPPALLHPDKFLTWLELQKPSLVQNNWD